MGVVMGKDVGEKISQRWTNLDEKSQNTLGNEGLFGQQWTWEI
jgi:hypothetical protein